MAHYSYVNIPDDSNVRIARCVTGLGPTGTRNNSVLGGWYFNNARVIFSATTNCTDPPIQQRSNSRNAGVVDLRNCETLTTIAQEGVYSCIIINSSMMNQTMKLGVYLSGRSKFSRLWVSFWSMESSKIIL